MDKGMKFNIYGNGYTRFGEKKYLKLKEHGFSYIDFNMAHTESLLYTLPDKEVDKLLLNEKKLMDEAKICISQVHGPWRWPPQDNTDEDRAERMDKMKKSIRLTSVLGCKNWVVHPIMPFGIEDIGTQYKQKTWDMNIDFMTKLLEFAKKYDVTICFENMPMLEFSLAKPVDILRFVKIMNDEHFKICLDTGHVNVFDELDIKEEVERLGNYIRVLHVHDNMANRDLHLFPKFGSINWKDFVDGLKNINYNGVFSMETKIPSDCTDELFERLCITHSKIVDEVLEER